MLVKKIDIHVHSLWEKDMPRLNGLSFATPEEIRAMYDQMGIEFGVLMAMSNPEACTHYVTNGDCRRIASKYPETFVWFCNIDPRMGKNSSTTDFTPFLEYYKAEGARGVGEICANLYFDDPMVENLFYHVEKAGLPLTFHLGTMGKGYGLVDDPGLPRLEKEMQKFPNLVFLGHSKKFWAEISGDASDTKGKVMPGGRVVELMRKYPNLHGDLSADSGQNALMRDPEFGYAFLEEFRDRLYFGTDITAPGQDKKRILTHFLDEAVEGGRISEDCYNKVCRENALRILKIEK